MGRIRIECGERKIRARRLARAVRRILGQRDNLMCELVYISEDEIRRLNRDTRGVDSVTDVLSFPTLNDIRGEILERKNHRLSTEGRYLYIGSIAVCEKRAEEQAEEYGHSTEREITYLVLHGLLHLFGYDHMTDEDKAQMRAIEKAVMKSLKMEEE